jgi:hypothetical protein
LSHFSVPDRGLPHYGIEDVVFPLGYAESAYEAVTQLLSAMSHGVRARNAAADEALVNWTGSYARYFREARDTWLDGRLVYAELQTLQARLLKALKSYQELQRNVIALRQQAHDDFLAGRRPPIHHLE